MRTSSAAAAWLLWVRRKVWIVRWFDELRQNFWFTPLLGASIGPLAAVGLLQVPLDDLAWMPDGETQRAFSVMIAGTMMAVTASTFTLVMAVLSLASSQFGPRLIRQFLKDGTSQTTLALFLGIASYHSTALMWSSNTPTFTVFYGGVAFAALGVVGLVVFLQHVAQSVNADVVVRRVADELATTVHTLCSHADVITPPGPFEHAVLATSSGYLQAVDLIRLRDHASDNDNAYQVAVRPGTFVLQGDPVVRARNPLAEGHAHVLLQAIWLGAARSSTQDIEFAMEQLAEMAVRALSPGINDPYTASRCIDHIGDALLQVHRSGRPEACLRDGDDTPRVWIRWPNLEQIRAAGVDRIRHAADNDPLTLAHLDQMVERVAHHADTASS